ncbi:MAG: hypothetical protein MUF54_11915 [Polyangiaceae bacterium]|jgi:hypothetical protein|nr:hypothetical protein [Polyangiaceae bacterium]
MPDDTELEGRCGTCARFIRVREQHDASGVLRRVGDCLLEAWPSPLHERNTCTHYVRRGSFPSRAEPAARARTGSQTNKVATLPTRRPTTIPEDLLAMDAEEFRTVLREVLREELGVGDTELGARWAGGEVILKPGREGVAEKRMPIESLFHKIVMIRDKLRVLEQRINSHTKLSDEEKVAMQQYVTQCYGTLTTFNVLFATRDDAFKGQRGKDD